jgi:transposase
MDITFETVNSQAAGIDTGAEKIFVSAAVIPFIGFETFTADYLRCVSYLKEIKIECVAMEATGVYWRDLYEILENNGMEVCLMNPKEVKQVKGRKTNVKDCQLIQKLFSAGLLRQS